MSGLPFPGMSGHGDVCESGEVEAALRKRGSGGAMSSSSVSIHLLLRHVGEHYAEGVAT